MRRAALALGVLAGAALLAACDAAGLDAFEPEVVVSAVLVTGQPLPPVSFALTGPLSEPYDPAASAVADAEVTVSLLAPDGSAEASYPYAHVGEGVYAVVGENEAVLPGRRYRLEAVVPGFDDAVTAETTTPAAFEVARPPESPVAYQQGDAPTLDVTPSGDGERPAVYVLTFEALDPSPEALTPFAADLVNERDVDIEDLTTTNSPLLNEGNYQQNPDGTLRIELPWFAFNFYGPTRVTVTALDEALATFLEFQAIQFVPTTISPGEIPNVPTNVSHGAGVFGAVAQGQAELVVERP